MRCALASIGFIEKSGNVFYRDETIDKEIDGLSFLSVI